MKHQSAANSMKYIWGAFLVALFIVNSNMVLNGQMVDWANIIMTGIIATAATATSIVTWGVTASITDDYSQVQSSDEKLKRGKRVERLIELMEPDELYELRERLQDTYREPQRDYMLGDDGELMQKRSNRT